MNDQNTFYNRTATANAQLSPGNYLVVGPRSTTYLGSKPDGTTPSGPLTVNGDQKIDLTSGLTYTNASAAAAAPSNIAPVQSLVAAIDAPNHGGSGSVRGLNVSEPFPVSTAAGTPYPNPTFARQSYGDGTMAGLYPDVPLDKTAGRPLSELAASPSDGQQTQKYTNYRTAFLQRLANPLQRWNPPSGHAEHDASLPLNPYITVDWQPIDLTVFNGEDRSAWTNTQVSEQGGPFDPDDPNADWQNGGAADPQFGSRHRSARFAEFVEHNQRQPNQHRRPAIRRVADFFQFNLQHTLGYLNSSYGTPLGGPGPGRSGQAPSPG